MLAAYFPGRTMAEETSQLWEREILGYDQRDGINAARELGSMSKFMPSLAEFVDAVREERNRRVISETLALPPSGAVVFCSMEQFLRERPDMQERVRKLGIWRDTLERATGA
jgi:hypothetical protein